MLNLQSFATTWVQVGDHEFIDKDNIKYYVNDHGTIQYAQKTYWFKMYNYDDSYKRTEKDLGKKVSYVVNQRIIDTNKKAIATKATVLYDEQGQFLANYTWKDYELSWTAIVPNTNGEFWYELVRKPRHLKKMYKYQLEQQNNK